MKYIKTFEKFFDNVDVNKLPETLYHVTTRYKEVLDSGYLKAYSGMNAGGLGGYNNNGVSLVTDYNIANKILKRLEVYREINCSNSLEELYDIINKLPNGSDWVLEQFNSRIQNRDLELDYIKDHLFISLGMYYLFTKEELNIIIYNPSNLGKDLGIIKINRRNLIGLEIIEGADKDTGEIRVLGDVKI